MIDLKTTFNQAQSYQAVLQIANNAAPQLSFWGCRYLTVPGYQGSLPLDALAERTIKLQLANFEFSEDERVTGRELTARINQFYTASDKQVKLAKLFTRILVVLRTWKEYIPLYPNVTRWAWQCDWSETAGNVYFRYYTSSQFQNAFGYVPPDEPDLTSGNLPPRWRAPLI